MISNILNYAGILITASGGYTLSGGASNINANWDTPAQLWDGGTDKRYIFWGDTEGTLEVFEFNFVATSATDFTLITNSAYDNAALSVTIEMTASGVATPVIILPDCVYNPGMVNAQLRPMGDRLVVEGATSFKILRTNA